MTSPKQEPSTTTSHDLRITAYLRTKYSHLDLSDPFSPSFLEDELLIDATLSTIMQHYNGKRQVPKFIPFDEFCKIICFHLNHELICD